MPYPTKEIYKGGSIHGRWTRSYFEEVLTHAKAGLLLLI